MADVKIVLAGGSGALGRALAADLTAHGHQVVVLSRRPSPGALLWDGRTTGDWAPQLRGSVLINLAGEIVDRPPTPANVELLTRSRVEPTRALAEAAGAHPPALWLQLSTLAIYGDAGEPVLDESAKPADGPAQMAGVAGAWEQAARGAPCGRQVILRTAVVFEPGTPALQRLVSLTRWGLGGRVGSGRQWVSWLHVADFLAAVRFLIDSQDLAGVVHLTSPHPVRNAELMATFRRVLGRPPSPPTPEFLVKLGARVLRTDPALGLTGRRCVPGRLLEAGFEFGHPRLEEALRDLLTRG
ncbi:TIGR01777 family oxidoreductase [Nonomuraea soli]